MKVAADGARPPAVGTTAQPYTAGRPAPLRLTSALRRDLHPDATGRVCGEGCESGGMKRSGTFEAGHSSAIHFCPDMAWRFLDGLSAAKVEGKRCTGISQITENPSQNILQGVFAVRTGL